MSVATTTKERPILFSAPMVRAILEGRKTQTRRIVAANNSTVLGHPAKTYWPNLLFGHARPMRKASIMVAACGEDAPDDVHLSVPYQHPGDPIEPPENLPWYRVRPKWSVGDRLWGRETWADAMSDAGPLICYRADLGRRYLEMDAWPIEYDRYPGCKFANWASDLERGIEGVWRPSIHMPRWASRIDLEITGVRVERAQAISHEDAIAEGCAGSNWVASSPYIIGPHTDDGELPVEEFERRWGDIHGPDAWRRNDWVWAIEFRRIKP